jgi:proline dehydrogenase
MRGAKQTRQRLKGLLENELNYLTLLYGSEERNSQEIERSVRITKALIEAIKKLEEKQNINDKETIQVKIVLDEDKNES